MSPSFKKYFSKKESVSKEIPESIIKELSNRLPGNNSYEQKEDGILTLQPFGEDMKITIPRNLEDEVFKEFQPENSKEFADYLFRTQQSYKFNGDLDEVFTIGEKSFKIDDVIKRPFEKTRDISLRISPPEFPPPFTLKFEFGDIIKDFVVKRIPNPSMQELHFKTINVPYFDINYVIHEDRNTLSLSFRAHLDRTKTVTSHIECYKMYKACVNKDLKLNDSPLTLGTLTSDTTVKNIEKVLEFWEKVKVVEDYLNVEFIPTQDIMMNEAALVEELYRSLKKNIPTKSFINIEEINLSGPSDELDIKNLIDSPNLSFSFHQTENVILFGEKLNLKCIIYFFNLRIKEVKKEEGDGIYKLIVDPIEDEHIYQSRLFVSSYEVDSLTLEKFKNADELDMDIT